MEFEDFSQDFNDLWTTDYGETIKGPSDIFDLSYLLEGGQQSTPEVVLNDRLMTEASLALVSQITKSITPTSSTTLSIPIKSEHSYSLSRDRSQNDKGDHFLDIEDECFPAMSIAEAEGTHPLKEDAPGYLSIANVANLPSDVQDMDQLSSSDTMSCCDETEFIEESSLDDVTLTESCLDHVSGINETVQSDRNDINILTNSQIFEEVGNQTCDTNTVKITPPSLTCSTNASLPGFSINSGLRHIYSSKSINQNFQNNKNLLPFSVSLSEQSFLQAGDRNGNYPPTPPSSSGSDNESICTSPRIPLYETLSPQYCSPIKKFSLKSSRTPILTPLISSQPKGATGVINLTQEEKRTLLLEGYPVPSKLPLTKMEEKSLKKIRRKIKNKISAQESRRKKKEYMDKLEVKVEELETENGEYTKKIVLLQNKNSTLLQELKSLQNMIARDDGRISNDTCSLNL